MLNIISGNQPIAIERLIILFYGQPGVGKTTTAFSASKPLALDFDNGVYRSQYRKDALPISSWADAVQLLQERETLQQYDTVIIDTVGRCLDFLAQDIILNDYKMATKNGGLSMRGYGALKSQFKDWIKNLMHTGLDVVMIAHDKEEKDGDDVRVRPDITGGSYSEVMKLADLVGYMHNVNNKPTLDFNPTDKWVGKNSANKPPLEIPRMSDQPDWLASIIRQTKASLGQVDQANADMLEEVASWQAKVDELVEPEEFDKVKADVEALDNPLKSQVKRILAKRMEKAGVTYDKEQNCFVRRAA